MRNWLAPAGIAVGVIALGAIALLREPAQLDPTTPEGVVQEYLQAISDEDYDEAFDFLHPESFEGCDSQDIARSTPVDFFSASLAGNEGEFRQPHFEPRFDEEGPIADRPFVDTDAWVDVIIHRGDRGGGPFGSGWEEWTSFGLVDEDGFWWIVGDPWPHFAWGCADFQGDF